MKIPLLASIAGSLLASGCAAMGPNYHRPDLATPSAYKNQNAAESPRPATAAPIEQWWQIFGDETLNRLETEALAHNPRIEGAVAAISEARAALGIANAAKAPSLNGSAQVQAAGETSQQTIPILNQSYRTRGSSYTLPFTASYEIDLWGRVRRSTESASALVEASTADYRGVLLSLTTDVAHDYFLLRALDREALIVKDTELGRRNAAEVQAARFRSGMANELDVHRANVEAATLAADLADLNRQREQTANALAVATGVASSVFFGPGGVSTLANPPAIPPGLPAQLIARRPDLAGAEATLHARTADIGVAQAARMPTISLTGNAGFASTELHNLLSRPGQFWNVGSSLTAPIFDGGRLRSAVDQAKARAVEAAANYRQQTLVALQEVEDSLVALSAQSLQGAAQDEAQTEAAIVATLAKIRYDSGLANYLDVTDADRSLLQVERSQVQLVAARYTTTVGLIRALGGAW